MPYYPDLDETIEYFHGTISKERNAIINNFKECEEKTNAIKHIDAAIEKLYEMDNLKEKILDDMTKAIEFSIKYIQSHK